MKDWELEMRAVYESHKNRCSDDIEGILKELEEIAHEHLNNSTMSEGDEFVFPATTGIIFTLKFYKDITEIYTHGIGDMKKSGILTRSNCAEKRISYERAREILLNIYKSTICSPANHIGEMYPEALVSVLQNLEADDVIAFTDSSMYLCTKPGICGLELAKINITQNSIDAGQSEYISLDDRDGMVRFYNQICKNHTQRVEYIIFKGDRDNPYFTNALINIGIHKRFYVWEDDTGSIEDIYIEKKIEDTFLNTDYGSAYDIMIDYVNKANGKLAIQMKFFEYVDKDPVFNQVFITKDNENIRSYLVTEDKNIKNINKEWFINKCKEHYKQTLLITRTEELDKMQQQSTSTAG